MDSVVVISSDDEMEVDSSPFKQTVRKRQRISSVSDCSIERMEHLHF